jgi:hypothetical protein
LGGWGRGRYGFARLAEWTPSVLGPPNGYIASRCAGLLTA